MALDPVPWAIGDVAEHGPDVARQLAYLACGGREGIGSPGDLKVTALSVPGAGVQVAAGGASILNRTASQQAYTARNPVADTTSVKIAATGSSAGRSDIVALVVDNPYIDGNAQAPADPVKGPYNRFAVFSGVPSDATDLQSIPQYAGYSAIELCRIDIPKSTGTITNAMITDLRSLANPLTERVIVGGTTTSKLYTLSGSDWQNFPPEPIDGIHIPSWATHASIRMDTTIRSRSGNPLAALQSFLTVAGNLDSSTLYSDQTIDFPSVSNAGDVLRQPLVSPSQGFWPIPSSMRGKGAKLVTRIRKSSAASDGASVGSSTTDYYVADITFTQRIS